MRVFQVITLTLLLSSLLASCVSGANIVETESEQRFTVEFPSEDIDLELDIEITEYICGYSLDRRQGVIANQTMHQGNYGLNSQFQITALVTYSNLKSIMKESLMQLIYQLTFVKEICTFLSIYCVKVRMICMGIQNRIYC